MKIGIHDRRSSFSDRWIVYCQQNSIPFKIVRCYDSDIVAQLDDCDALMWHYHHTSPRDVLFAGKLLSALEQSGKVVFPDFFTAWHFDDKIAQKYLFESLGIPAVDTWVFYSKDEARRWAGSTSFPKVFKLRGGAGSEHVRLVRSKSQALALISKAFSKGFSHYDALGNLKERFRKYRLGKTSLADVGKGIARLFLPTAHARQQGRARGYAYFQEFIPENTFDIRVVIIDNKAFAIKRMVRENDFRASGSGFIKYGKNEFDEQVISHTFELNKKLKSQCLAVDYVIYKGKPLLIEMSYGFSQEGYDACPGYWDESMKWHEGKFNAQGWMVEAVIKKIRSNQYNTNP